MPEKTKRSIMIKTTILWLVMLAVCASCVLLALPTVNENIDDPNMIAYFNHDEGYLMDLVWYYYTEQKRESFQYDRDYGLEFRYLSDLARVFLSKFIDLTPGTFVLILRWTHLISWILAIIFLGFMVRYHFGGIWQPITAVLLLGTNPVFSELSGNSKPEPLVLLFMLIGMHYMLRIIGEQPRRYTILATLFAALAFVVKYAGVFLLPGVVAALFLANFNKRNDIKTFPDSKFAWLFPGVVGVLCTFLALSTIFFYKRRSTGLTWYQETGLWQSLLQNKELFYIILFGTILVITSLILYFFKRSKNIKSYFINSINSNCFIVFMLFVFFCCIVGFRWVLHPIHFIDVFAQAGRDAFGYSHQTVLPGGFSFIENLIFKIRKLNPIIFSLFIVYIITEFFTWRKITEKEKPIFFKRVVLVVFLFPFLLYMFSRGRTSSHHMLPFFVATSILAMQGIMKIRSLLGNKIIAKSLTMGFISLLLITTIIQNAILTKDAFLYSYHKKHDVVFDIIRWWRKNYSTNTHILADHPIRVYLPPEYNNVKFIKHSGHDGISSQIKELAEDFKPKLVYYNSGVDLGVRVPPLEDILKNQKVKLVKSFDNRNRQYKRWPRSQFVVYEIIYDYN